MYYLSLDDVVLQSEYTEIVIVRDDTVAEPTFQLSMSQHNVTITINSDTTYGQISDYVICKPWIYPEHTCDIEPGSYLLYKEVKINGYHLALSDSSLTRNFNQYVLEPGDCPINTIEVNGDSIDVKLNSCITQDDYITLLNESLHFTVLSVDDDAIIGTIIGVIFERANKIDVRSTRILTLKEERLLVEEADYIAALILKLKATYPRVQFYNADQDIDDSKYTEFVKYRAQTGTYQSDILTTPVMSDPIYGDVFRTTCQIDFEYHTTDFAVFNKRKFDYQINRFLSNITTCDFKFPNTDRHVPFTVHWDRGSTADSYDFQMATQLNEDGKSQYSFTSNIKIIVTIYRMANSYPYIKQVILKHKIKITETPHFLDSTLVIE